MPGRAAAEKMIAAYNRRRAEEKKAMSDETETATTTTMNVSPDAAKALGLEPEVRVTDALGQDAVLHQPVLEPPADAPGLGLLDVPQLQAAYGAVAREYEQHRRRRERQDLRDAFAVAAVHAVQAPNSREAARMAYDLADAMLAERDRRIERDETEAKK
jgi:hypothetical protein